MVFRALCAGGLTLLVALVATPATKAGAAGTTSKSATSGTTLKRGTAGSRAAAPSTHRRRRVRRPPPGGVYARSAIVIDPATGEVLFEKNSDSSVPIASLTKLMTVMVFLEQEPDLTREVEVTRTELTGGGHTRLRNHEMVALGDLLHMSLMCSDNVATRVLVRESGLSPEDFLARMNKKGIELGLARTRFVETTGLDERNVSTAADVARLLHAASDMPLIKDITSMRAYQFRSASSRPHAVRNTNRLLYSHYEIVSGKTGFIFEAGYCFATWLRTGGRDMIAVVLGAPTNATRFADVVRLIKKTTAPAVASDHP